MVVTNIVRGQTALVSTPSLTELDTLVSFSIKSFIEKGRLVYPKRGTVFCEFENGKVKGKCVLEKPEAISKIHFN